MGIRKLKKGDGTAVDIGNEDIAQYVAMGGTTNSNGDPAGDVVAEVSTPTGTWFSKTYTTANSNGEASGTIESLSLPAGIIAAKVQFNDLASSSLTKLGIVIGVYTESEADVAITALFAGTTTEALQIALNDELQTEFNASDLATLIGWKSTGTDTGTNEVIVSWKV